MRYFLQLALVAMFLFSVSAALSLWLNQSRITTEAKEAAEKPAKKAGGDDPAPEKEKGPRPQPKPPEVPTPPDASPASAMASLRDREDRLVRRQARTDLILRDLQSEREAVDALVRRVTEETKQAATRAAEEAKAPPPAAKKDAGVDAAAEEQNVGQLARLYDAMPAESAAPILRKMADSGRMDTAVRILAKMKDRQAAQVLAAFGDTDLAAQVTDKVRLMRRATPAGAAPNLAPAGGAARNP